MTNGEKFQTPKERAREYKKYCSSHGMGCNKCPLNKFSSVRCPYEWLNLEYKEEVKKCPFCGGKARIASDIHEGIEYHRVECTKCYCCTSGKLSLDRAIEVWNWRHNEAN